MSHLFLFVEKCFVHLSRRVGKTEREKLVDGKTVRRENGWENSQTLKRKCKEKSAWLLFFAMFSLAHIDEQNNNVSAERPATERIKSTLQTVFLLSILSIGIVVFGGASRGQHPLKDVAESEREKLGSRES